MPGCPSEHILLRFVAGGLDQEEAAVLHQHIDECAACLRLVAQTADSLLPEHLPDAPGAGALRSTSPAPQAGPIPEVPSLLTAGTQVGRYRVMHVVGSGAMGVVYAARDLQLGRRVALKLLRTELMAGSRAAALQARLLREAQAMARLSSSAVVAVHDVGVEGGQVFVAMEFIEGTTLRKWLKERPRQWTEVLDMFVRAGSGLRAAHTAGLVHRDFKPDNVLVSSDGRVLVTDFGLARVEDAPSAASLSEMSGPGGLLPGENLTGTGMVLGTPAYMSPEQMDGGAIDARADVFSFCASLYEALYGERPFAADSLAELQRAIRHGQVRKPPLGARVPSYLRPVLVRGLRLHPADRHASMDELLTALRKGPRERAHRLPWGAGMTGLILLALVLGQRLLRAPQGAGVLAERAGAGPARRPEEVMVPIQGGSFHMGSPPDEIEAAHLWCQSLIGDDCPRALFEREQPVRLVSIGPFRLDATEVTNEQFARWLDQQPALHVRDERWVERGGVLLADLYPTYGSSHGLLYRSGHFLPYPSFERRPATQLTWDAARRYCESQGKRLPTEAEWEFAARGSAERRFPWGFEDPRCDGVVLARSKGLACAGLGLLPAEVATAAQDRTPQGVFDLAGNVSEWVSDQFRERYPPCGSERCTDPRAEEAPAPPGPGVRVVRGGNWNLSAPAARAASRSRLQQSGTSTNIGFRCAAPSP